MMGHDFQFRDKIGVAILGATGAVGQRFIELLANHPWFEIVALAASERSVGKPYCEAVNWIMSSPIPASVREMVVKPCSTSFNCPIIFSALDASVAGPIELECAKRGAIVVTNTRNHRMAKEVPLLVPEVNSEHLKVLHHHSHKIVANPNCSTIGLVIALKPLFEKFGIESVFVSTMQAISGAGYPGVASFDIIDNVVPHISGEEHKMETEPLKILGVFKDGQIENTHFKISAHCNRVPVIDGHTECVSIKFKKVPKAEEIIQAWDDYKSGIDDWRLPSQPQKLIHYFNEANYPQPRLHRMLDKGMAVSIGGLRPCSIMDFKFRLLSHNTIRGAAGGAVLCAEALVKAGHVRW